MPKNKGNWIKTFVVIFTGQSFSILTSAIVQFSLIWWITEKTGDSASALAFATLMGQLPQVIIGPFAGAIVDKFKRKTIIIASDSIIAMATLVLIISMKLNPDSTRLGVVYAVLAVRSAASAFHWPAMESSMSMLVPAKHITRVNGINTMQYSIMAIAGPALGSILLDVMKIENILMFDLLGAAIANVMLVFVKFPELSDLVKGFNKLNIIEDVKIGLKELIKHKGLLLLTLACTVGAIFDTPPSSLRPLLVKTYYGLGHKELSMMQIALGIGTFSGSFILGTWGGFKKNINTMILAYVFMGAAYTSIGFMPNTAFPFAVAMMVPLGIAGGFYYSAFMAMIQTYIPYDKQGRVLSVVQSLLWLAGPVGLMISGPLADKMGVNVVYLISGIGTLLILFFIVSNKTIRNYEDVSIKAEDMGKGVN